MADNVITNQPTTVGATIATDDVSSVQHQLVKIEYGLDGVATMVSATNPLPVATGLTQPTTPSDTQPVSAASLPLPSGAATAANQTTGNTSLSTIAGSISGTEMQVDVVTMPTTTVQATNLDIRDLTSASDSVLMYGSDDGGTTKRVLKTDAGGAIQVDLEVASVTVSSGAITETNSAAIKTAVEILDNAISGSEMQVDIVTSALPTGASTLAEQQTQTTALQLIDDTVKTLGTDTYTEATTKGLAIGAVRRDADTSAVNTDNEVAPLLVNAIGALKVEVFSGETLPVSGTVGVTGVATLAEQQTQTTALQLIDNAVSGAGFNITQQGGVAVSLNTGVRDAGTQRVTIATNDSVPVTFTGSTDAATQTTLASALTSLQLIDDTVFTDDTSTHATGTTKGLGIMAVANPTDAAVEANDIGMVAMTLARAMKNDITTIAGTAPTTAGKLDVKGADGDVFVRQATAANLNMTEASAASALTSLQLLDDVVATLGTTTYTEASTKGNIIGAVRRDANTSLVDTTNEIAPLQLNATGELKVAQIQAIPAGNNNIGDVDIVSGTITTVSTVTNISQQGGVAISLNTGVRDTGTQRVTIATNDLVPVSDNAGSLTVDAPLATPVNVQIGNATLAAGVIDETGAAAVDALAVGGGTAHDAVDSGNPIKIGGVAVSGSATPTSVASGDRTRFIANQHGIPYVISGHPNLIVREFDFGTAAQTDLNLAAAVVAADERIYVVGFEATCDNANSVAVSVRCGFGTVSVPTASATGVSGMIGSHPGLAAGSGLIEGTGAGIIAVGGAGEEPRLTSSAATSGNLHVIIRYFLIDETP